MAAPGSRGVPWLHGRGEDLHLGGQLEGMLCAPWQASPVRGFVGWSSLGRVGSRACHPPCAHAGLGAGCGSGVFLGHDSLWAGKAEDPGFTASTGSCCRQARCPLEQGLLLPCARRFIALGSDPKVAAGPSQLLVSLGCPPVMMETAKKNHL